MKKSQAAAAALGKVFKGKARLLCFSGEAKSGPAIGQALGPLGVNMAEFCKQFNAATTLMKPGLPCPTQLTAYADRTFSFKVKQPPTVWFLRRAANIERGSGKAQKDIVGRITLKQLYEIAQIKNRDQPWLPLIAVCRMVAGTAKSMGVEVIDGRDKIPQGQVAVSMQNRFTRKGKKVVAVNSY